MATTEQLDPKIHYGEQLIGTKEVLGRSPFFPMIRWSSVIAGVAVGMSIQLVLAMLGIATGLTVMDFDIENRMGYGPLIWVSLNMLIAAFAGGYVTARMSGMRRKSDGALHGAVCWAVSTLLFTVMASSASGSLLSAVFNNIGSDVSRKVQSSDPGAAILPMGELGGNVGAADLQALQQYIQTGQKEEAILLLIAMGIEPERAGMIVDQAMIVFGNPEQASSQSVAMANRALETADAAAWIIFAGVFLSLLMSAAGGVVGAMDSRRKIWKKEDIPPVSEG